MTDLAGELKRLRLPMVAIVAQETTREHDELDVSLELVADVGGNEVGAKVAREGGMEAVALDAVLTLMERGEDAVLRDLQPGDRFLLTLSRA